MAENMRDSNEQINPSVASSKQSSLENMSNAGAGGDTNVKQTRPNSSNKGDTFQWFRHDDAECASARNESSEDRNQRLKILRDKQNEERQKKLEELKAQALAAQRFREIKEEERRKRIEELRIRDNDRRQQVGERKRLICEAERDRRESILKKNMEREARFELKRKFERSSLAFAFGSSTPRMLEPADTGGSFWGHRRATSTNNIMFAVAPLTRRSSERELVGSKKRATSAGGLDRSATDDMRMSSSMYEVFHWDELSAPNSSDIIRSSCPQTNQNLSANNSEGSTNIISTSRGVSSLLGNGETIAAGCASGHVGRRRTDLMPTIPTRDTTSPVVRRPFTKSPGRTYSLSRLDQLAKPRKRTCTDLPAVLEGAQHQPIGLKQTSSHSSSTNTKSMSRSMGHLAVGWLTTQSVTAPVPAPQRPFRHSNSRSMYQLSAAGSVASAPPVPPPRTTRAVLLRKRALDSPEGPSRPDSSLSQQSTSSVSSAVNLRSRPLATTKKPRPASIAVTGVTHDSNKNPIINDNIKKSDGGKPPLPRPSKSAHAKFTSDKTGKLTKTSPRTTPKATPLQSPSMTTTMSLVEIPNENLSASPTDHTIATNVAESKPANSMQVSDITTTVHEPTDSVEKMDTNEIDMSESLHSVSNVNPPLLDKSTEQITEEQSLDTAEMTASMVAKVRITTEEEAKAALAERRRLAREEAERQAEAERLRIEEEFRLEQERQRQEEEQLRLLAEEQRRVEEERLAQAIRETQKREEEEKLKREEELRQKLEKEEQERKAREESEKQRIEMQERLKQEEKEREARRKRVEAIMLRTRAKVHFGSPSKLQEESVNNEKSSNEETKTNKANNKSTIESYETAVNEKEATLFNGSLKNSAPVISKENDENHTSTAHHSNGHRIGVDITDDFSKDDKNVMQHNVTNTLLDIGELDPYKNANTNLELTSVKITNEDNVNSNNPAESHSTTNTPF